MDLLLADIELRAKKFKTVHKLEIISDKDDNKLLELAEEAEANFLITGDLNDFTMPSYKKTQIISPREYWENHKPSD